MSGSRGKITFGSDFTGSYASVAWGAAQLVAGDAFGGGIGFTSVNEGSFASTVDEPGGILAITTDTADNDSAALISGPFKAEDGRVVAEARFKYSNVDCAVFFGFSETMALDTPVMPAEFATVTMSYNGAGGILGLQYDVDGTTDDWRAVMGDGGAAVSGSGNGIRANATVTADRWVIARAILSPDGSGEVYLGEVGHVDSNGIPSLRLIKRFAAGLNPADLVYAVLMIENRSGAARVLEVDYFEGESYRDWRAA